MQIIDISVTTDTAGDGTTTHGSHVQGYLYAIQLVDGDFADGVDANLDCVNDELTYAVYDELNFNSDKMVHPRVLEQLNTDGTDLSTHCEILIFGKPKLTIAQGGAVKTGSIRLFVRDWD